MASVIKRAYQKSGGTASVAGYTVPQDTTSVLIGMNIANITDTTISVDIKYKIGSDEVYILKGISIPPNTSFTPTGMEQKLAMMDGDQLIVTSNVDNAFDLLLSFSEITS